ncbi:hypothetical protein [Plantactinospora sp. GCM10030261]|uniref:hypothetical protein n=1 Tax=Plantactinospora sp. GCM10030261 TaxID=3273420 RepID=UPI00361B5538
MTTRTRPNPADFTDLIVTATGDDIAALTDLARRAGVLVYRSTPRPAGRNDPRHRVLIRLHLHHP